MKNVIGFVASLFLITGMRCWAYTLQIRNMGDDEFQVRATSEPTTVPARGIVHSFNYGLEIEATQGPYAGIKGTYMGTEASSLRAFIKEGLPVMTIDADVTDPFQNMVHDEKSKERARKILAKGEGHRAGHRSEGPEPATSDIQEAPHRRPSKKSEKREEGHEKNERNQERNEHDRQNDQSDNQGENNQDKKPSSRSESNRQPEGNARGGHKSQGHAGGHHHHSSE